MQISIENMAFGFGKAFRLEIDRWELPHGRSALICGPNGSGKTTLLDILAGVLKPMAGTVTFQGKPLNQWPKKQLARTNGL